MTQISGQTNNLDLYSDARKWCGIPTSDTTTYPLAEFVRDANFGLDRVISLIMRADGKWQFDDTNQTDAILSVADLVANQQDYAISIAFLKIKKLRIKDSSGNLITLKPIDRRQLTDQQLRKDAGDPKFYDKLGNSLYLHPKPSYASTEGLEIQFQRGASYFVYDDTTKAPGFATQFHRLISLYGAFDYCSSNDMESKAIKIQNKINLMEAELIEFYANRDEDQKIGLRVAKEDYGQLTGGISNPDGF